MSCSIVIVVLCGLPGCGKSTLANIVKEKCQLSDFDSLRNVKCIIVRYDDLIPSDLIYETNFSAGDSEWKEHRRCILAAVIQIVISFKNQETIHLHRSDHDIVQQIKSKIITNNELGNIEVTDQDSKLIVVIDDNMYFKSMRYEYFQLTRQCKKHKPLTSYYCN